MFKIVTPPAVEPISLTEAKLQLRVSGSEEDEFITSLIVAAREHAENHMNRSLITQTWDYYLDYFSNVMMIQKSPVASITSIKYQDEDNAEQTLASTYYDADLVSEPARVTLAYGKDWPDTYNKTNAVVMRLVTGYGLAVSVPSQIKQGMYLYITYLYEHRGDESIRPPRAIYDLWNNYRVQYL